MAPAREALADDDPHPWSRGTLAPGVTIGVGPGSDVTSLSFGVGLDWFAGRGFSLVDGNVRMLGAFTLISLLSGALLFRYVVEE